MIYSIDIINKLADKVSGIADKNGYGTSYSYQYGYFQSAIANMLNNILTPEQLQQLEEEVNKK